MSGCVLMAISKCSITSAYRSGDRGHPCLVPFLIGKRGDSDPFILICAWGALYRAFIFALILGPRPIWDNVSSRKVQSTRSNAFSASNDRMRADVFCWVVW
ncbi:hypothetical protein GDO81_025181 [Engystomops pustulosus]|uniref:Uncharacterized protein n=1 Tax=Engystomops pustulosus TaxID=76066 RepID=A0AAV6YQD2_ENGPU|nr:hypothetical protein GDO81_025181 [Engystomops pustulosus]